MSNSSRSNSAISRTPEIQRSYKSVGLFVVVIMLLTFVSSSMAVLSIFAPGSENVDFSEKLTEFFDQFKESETSSDLSDDSTIPAYPTDQEEEISDGLPQADKMLDPDFDLDKWGLVQVPSQEDQDLIDDAYSTQLPTEYQLVDLTDLLSYKSMRIPGNSSLYIPEYGSVTNSTYIAFEAQREVFSGGYRYSDETRDDQIIRGVALCGRDVQTYYATSNTDRILVVGKYGYLTTAFGSDGGSYNLSMTDCVELGPVPF